MKPTIFLLIFLCLWMYSKAVGARTSKMPSNCKGADCFDTDYEEEDAVRKTLLSQNSANEINYTPPDPERKTKPGFNKIAHWNKIKFWTAWWSEWKDKNCSGTKNCLRNPTRQKVKLCYVQNQTHLLECDNPVAMNATIACIGAKSSKVEDCKNFRDKGMHFPICREKSSNKVITCGESTPAFLCFPDGNETTPIRPCRIQRRQICLTAKGSMTQCKNIKLIYKSKNKENDLETIDMIFTQTRDWAEWWKEWVLEIPGTSNDEPDNESTQLCISKANNTNIVVCRKDSEKLRACVSAKAGKVSECSKIKNAEIPVTICKEKSSNRIITCGNFTSAFLCFSNINKMLTIRPCRFKNRQVCLSKQHKMEICQKTTNYLSDEFKSPPKNDITKYIINRKRKYAMQVHSTMKQLCLEYPKERLVFCRGDKTLSFACLNTDKGLIGLCGDMEKNSEKYLPVCALASNNTLKICGRLSQLNICISKGKMGKLLNCNKKRSNACLLDGSIKKCTSAVMKYRRSKRTTFRNTDYGNDERVYNVERIYHDGIMRDVKNLCQPDSAEGKFRYCKEDPDLNFLCFGTKEGIVKKCQDFKNTELAIPTCVKNDDNKVVTCGKISNTNICNKYVGKPFPYRPCTDQKRKVCLNDDGSLLSCIKSETNNIGETRSNIGLIIFKHRTRNIKRNVENHVPSSITHDYSNDEHQEYERFIAYGNENRHKGNSRKEYKYNVINKEEYKDNDNIKRESIDYGMNGLDYGDVKLLTFNENDNGEIRNNFLSKLKIINEKINDINKESDKYAHSVTKRGAVDELHKYRHKTLSQMELELGFDDSDYSNDADEDESIEDELKIENVKKIKKKEEALVASMHLVSKHLCFPKRPRKHLVNCDEDPDVNFACIGAYKGKLFPCNTIKRNEVAFPVCTKISSNNLMTCDIYSNTQLCLFRINKTRSYKPCKNRNRFACLGKYGIPVKCNTSSDFLEKLSSVEYRNKKKDENNSKLRKNKSGKNKKPKKVVKEVTSDKTPRGSIQGSIDDEKFFRFNCHNCTIENKFIVEGTPDDIIPEIEAFTFSI